MPCAASHFQRTVADARDPQEATAEASRDAALRQGKLPPQAFDAGDTTLALDRLAELLG